MLNKFRKVNALCNKLLIFFDIAWIFKESLNSPLFTDLMLFPDILKYNIAEVMEQLISFCVNHACT